MTLVVDASVACKWVVEEPFSAEARALLHAGHDLIAPDLILAELGNAIWKRRRLGAIDAAQASRIVARLSSAFRQLVASEPLLTRAYAMAEELGHPIYDCFYLALAERESADLITADARLLKRIAGTQWGGRVRALASVIGST